MLAGWLAELHRLAPDAGSGAAEGMRAARGVLHQHARVVSHSLFSCDGRAVASSQLLPKRHTLRPLLISQQSKMIVPDALTAQRDRQTQGQAEACRNSPASHHYNPCVCRSIGQKQQLAASSATGPTITAGINSSSNTLLLNEIKKKCCFFKVTLYDIKMIVNWLGSQSVCQSSDFACQSSVGESL